MSNHVVASLRARYLLALVFLVTLAAGSFAVDGAKTSDRKDDAAVVNVAGRQRMLSQRIALLASELASGRPQARTELERAIALMRVSQRALIEGSQELGLPRERSPAVLRLYLEAPDEIDGRVRAYLSSADRTLIEPTRSHLRTLRVAAPMVLSDLDRVVRAQTAASERATAELKRLQTALFAAMLLLLAATGSGLFRPMVRRIAREIRFVQLLQDVAVAANEGESEREALQCALDRVCDLTGWPVGHLYLTDAQDGQLVSSGIWHVMGTEHLDAFRGASDRARFAPGVGLPGRVLQTRDPAWVNDLLADANFPRMVHAERAGLRSATAFPVLVRDEVVGVMEFFSFRAEPVDLELLEVMQHVGTQVGRVVERARAGRALEHQASHDFLTGLPNRALLRDRLGVALARTRRTGDDVAVLFIDIDNFKRVNDTHGHAAGDMLLRTVAARLHEVVRASDSLARLGGDELVVLAEDIGGEAEAVTFAARILDAFAEPFELGGELVAVSASIGLALRSTGGESIDIDKLLVDADHAMYDAKQAGGGCVQLYQESMRAGMVNGPRLEQDIFQALGRGELEVVYQLIVRTADGTVHGVEALLRWIHPEIGPIPPATFIPIAETTGAILPIGAWVLEQACQQVAGWQELISGLHVSVNVSPRQLNAPAFLDVTARALERSGLDARLLTMEITEGVLLEPGDASGATLARLARLGVRISLDDFGTGFSSLGYLDRYPIDELKIDRSLTARLTDPDSRQVAIVTAIREMAVALEVGIVIEGVETAEQMARASQLGCHLAQGYYLGRPASASEVKPLLTAATPAARRPIAAQKPEAEPIATGFARPPAADTSGRVY